VVQVRVQAPQRHERPAPHSESTIQVCSQFVFEFPLSVELAHPDPMPEVARMAPAVMISERAKEGVQRVDMKLLL
jgi:hypothetical protein